MAARGLGKGLDALIPQTIQKDAVVEQEIKKNKVSKDGLINVKITDIEPDRNQPRKDFDEDALEELADSIKKIGLLEPIIVRENKDRYIIVAGERRWRASRIAGLKEIPVIIGHYSEKEIAEIQIIENIQREGLNPIEEAWAYKNLVEKYGYTQDEIAEKVSKSRPSIANSMRLLKLCDQVQQMLKDNLISTGHARSLITIEDSDKQYEIAQRIMDEKLSVREVEKLIKNLDKPVKEKPEINKDLDIFYKDIAEKLKITLGTKVSISGKGDGSGKVEIEFYNNEDLDRIVNQMR